MQGKLDEADTLFNQSYALRCAYYGEPLAFIDSIKTHPSDNDNKTTTTTPTPDIPHPDIGASLTNVGLVSFFARRHAEAIEKLLPAVHLQHQYE